MQSHNRRTFLQTAIVGGLTASAFAANERINVAVVGVGIRGRIHVGEWAKQPNCRVAAVCDVHQEARDRAVIQVEQAQGQKPKAYVDMRRIFDDKEIDAISFATPNHWHALGTIWACQAGKDVYVEKPACYDIYEGGKMIEAARKYNRMVQVGSQGRSQAHRQLAVKRLREGAIGKVYQAKGVCFNPRNSIGHTPETPVPPGIDWDLFRGPAPMKPFTMNRFRYNWHWFWDTGNGDIGNQGPHEMDMARWALGDPGLPAHAVSTGGRFVWDDDGETPNTQLATFDYGNRQILFEVRNLFTPIDADVRRGDGSVGNIFFGSEGFMTLDALGFRIYKGGKRELVSEQKMMESLPGDAGPHFANFVAAMRSRNHGDLNADVEIGVTSVNLCHLANISYRVGRRLTVDTAGPRLIGDAEANQLLSRNYRAPFTVPDKV